LLKDVIRIVRVTKTKAHTTRSSGKTRNATIVTRKGIQQHIAAVRNLLMAVGVKRMTMTNPVLASQVKPAVSASCKRK
jgi:hypothetical protein